MRNILIITLVILSVLLPITVFYDSDEEEEKQEIQLSLDVQQANTFVEYLSQKQTAEAYKMLSEKSKEAMNSDTFTTYAQQSGLDASGKVTWTKSKELFFANKGKKFFGTFAYDEPEEGQEKSISVTVLLEQEKEDSWRVVDFRTSKIKSDAVEEQVLLKNLANSFIHNVVDNQLSSAYETSDKSQTLEEFQNSMKSTGLIQPKIEWKSVVGTLPQGQGFELIGTLQSISSSGVENKEISLSLKREERSQREGTDCLCTEGNETCLTPEGSVCSPQGEGLALENSQTIAEASTGEKHEVRSVYRNTIERKEVQWRVIDFRVNKEVVITNTSKDKDAWKKSRYTDLATRFTTLVSEKKFAQAYELSSKISKEVRTLEQFQADMEEAGFAQEGKAVWEKQNRALPGNGGFKLMGYFELKDSTEENQKRIPMYLHLMGNEDLSMEDKEHCFCPRNEDKTPNTLACVTIKGTSCTRSGTPSPTSKVRKIITEDGKDTIACHYRYPAWNKWNNQTQWSVLDYRSGESIRTRIFNQGSFASKPATTLDWFLLACGVGLLIAFLGLTGFYIKGLRGSPRELYLMFFTKLTEYCAYGSASAIMVLYLQNDVLIGGEALGDSAGYIYYMIWGLVSTIITMMVGAVCDTIGIKKCLMIGAIALIVSRLFMPFTSDIAWVTLLGFLPLAFGFAITGPVLKVGIKYFTTKKTATLGFGLFYTLMNVGFWIGAELADFFRKNYADGMQVWGYELTAYQAIILIGFLINIPDFVAILLMREGAVMTEKGLVIKEPKLAGATPEELKSTVRERRTKMISEFKTSLQWTWLIGVTAYILVDVNLHEWKIGVIKAGNYVWALVITMGLFAVGGLLYAGLSQLGTIKAGGGLDRIMSSVRKATEGTVEQLKENFQQKPFWIYMSMLGILVFVRLTFYIFHVMFPAYAMRVFGDDFPIASIFGSLNPAMIIFLVPLISTLTTRISSYTMLIVGTFVSGASVFLCFLPDGIVSIFANSWLGIWVFDYWLEVPLATQDPFLISLVIFIIIFTIGEAIWSPRLMQFSAEIAPRGKEGAYIALAVLPYFLGKIAATVMADQLTGLYFSEDMVDFTGHEMAWFTIAVMAMISPAGMLIFRKTFNQSEKMAEEADEEAEENTEQEA